MTALLRTVDLTKRFPGVIANDAVNFDLQAGEVHCLFGENGAGKSTLSACLFGFYRPDGGHIEFEDQPVAFRSPRDAIQKGIGMVHQHFVLVSEFSVLKNIVVGTHESGWRLDLDNARAKINALCAQFDISLDLDALVRDLAVGQQQWVEILKALYLDARVLILDEPTAVLTPQESKKLFRIVRQICARGLSVVLISHKMAEVMQADRVTVLRKGKVVATVRPEDVSAQELTRMMVGRDVELQVRRDRTRDTVAEKVPVLAVSGLRYHNARRALAVDDVSFSIARGEVLGLAGVSGNGQKELFELLSGILLPEAGTIQLGGEAITGLPSRHYMDNGVGLVPDDRFREGLIPEFSICENIVLGWQRHANYTRGMFLDQVRIGALGDELIADFQIVAPSGQTPVTHLSGGNAQKVILAREFSHSDKLLLANQPTRGVDLGIIEYVYKKILAKRDEGYAVLLALEELDDLLNLCDRIAVMSGGRIKGFVTPETTTIAEIGLLMTGGPEVAA